ncbi:MAG: conserved repeat domain protein, partial [Bacteroidota bacterium]|nr:conserved repeat domain protein [Bacteroidota bacterium]
EWISSSDPFYYSFPDSNVIVFTRNSYNDIPWAAQDSLRSMGYIKFRISPKKNLPNGSVIKNRAFINMDYNDPIQTNTVTRTVNSDFLKINIVSVYPHSNIKSSLFPNPFRDQTLLTFEYSLPTELTIFSLEGKILQQYSSSDNIYKIKRNTLTNGFYLYELRNPKTGELLDTGKLIVN